MPQGRLFETDEPEMPWEVAADEDRLAAAVVLNRPLETVFHYLLPPELVDEVGPGQRVKVPFGRGNQSLVGFCVAVEPPPRTTRKLKEVASVVDRRPLVDQRMLDLTRWIAERYLCSWGQVLHSVVPAGVKNRAGTRMLNFFEPAKGVSEKLFELDLPAKQFAVLETLCDADEPMTADQLMTAAKCGMGPVNGLREKGHVLVVRKRAERTELDFGDVERIDDLELNPTQREARDRVLEALRAREHRTFLLHGVTGSGKTEVYIQAIREVVEYGRQAIVLVPEISLTPQTIRRFRSRFDRVAVLHSHLTDAERHWHWERIRGGDVQVVVGARSAVFAPTPHLGLIVIDEEHETSFKQETAPRYHAREVARERARRESVPLLLGSATPTLESWRRCQEASDEGVASGEEVGGSGVGEISSSSPPSLDPPIAPSPDHLLSLPARVASRPLPPVIVVDVRNDPQIRKGQAIGRTLRNAMHSALEDRGQVILFLNLRGYSPVIWDKGADETVKCPDCDVSLVWHRDRNLAMCHSCEFETENPNELATDGSKGLRFLGTGTQRLEAEVRAKFGDATILRMDSDSMRKRGSHDVALERFRSGEIDVLLGTQMIAKGLDFPNVTLVGVIDADTMLHQPDFRASERTFQLISQVAGRTGRGERAGRVLVQSSCPTEPAIVKAAAHDYVGFVKGELAHRSELAYPPFRRLARVIVRGEDELVVRDHAKSMAEQLRAEADERCSGVRVVGPAPAPIRKQRAMFRFHLLLMSETLEPLRDVWRAASSNFPLTNDVDHAIDVDPMGMR